MHKVTPPLMPPPKLRYSNYVLSGSKVLCSSLLELHPHQRDFHHNFMDVVNTFASGILGSRYGN